MRRAHSDALIMRCDFTETGDQQYTCGACGQVVKAPQPPNANCRAFPNEAGDCKPPGAPCCGQPSILQRAWNLATAIGEFLAAPGLVDADAYRERLEVCDACDRRQEATCGVCGCFVSLKARGVAWHCPLGKWPGDRPAGPPLTRFNLHYFICPLRHGDNIWQWNVAELRKRLRLFNGRRLVTVATPDGRMDIDPPEAVLDAFGDDAAGIEWAFRRNDAAFREMPSFLPALRELQSTDPTEATFFAHAKGVSRGRNREAIRLWTEAMYRHNLDRFDDVAELLRRWPCFGIAKRYHAPDHWTGQASHGWHFAGSFWWANHAALFSRPGWDKMIRHGWATEAYPGTVFTADEAFCLALDGINEPYEAVEWRGLVESEKGLT